MKQLEFLFYRYYKSQCKLGNSDIAPFSAMLIIWFSTMLYYFSLSLLISLLFPRENSNNNSIITLSFLSVLMIVLYFLLVHKGKYKEIIKSHDKESFNKFNVWPILFPILGFILANISMILKLLQNQGRL